MQLAIPALVFRMIALNDMRQTDLRFVAADCVYKLFGAAVLGVPVVGERLLLRRRGGGRARLGAKEFMAAHVALTLPNTFILGVPILGAIYDPRQVEQYMSLLLVTQSCLQFPFIIGFLEYGGVQDEAMGGGAGGAAPEGGRSLPREITAATCRPRSPTRRPAGGGEELPEDGDVAPPPEEGAPAAEVLIGVPSAAGPSREPSLHRRVSMAFGLLPDPARPVARAPKTPASTARKVLSKVLRNPIIWSAVLGAVYSVLAQNFSWGMPKVLDLTTSMLGNCTLGLALFNIGLFMFGKPLLTCSWQQAVGGGVLRFVASPALALLAALTVGLPIRGEGTTLGKLLILQAALPQAVVSFAIAQEYKTYPGVFSTLINTTTLGSIPVVFFVYFLLELAG